MFDLMRKSEPLLFEITLVLVRLDHFVIAVWRTKTTESSRAKGLGNHRRQSQQSRMRLRLSLSRGLYGASDAKYSSEGGETYDYGPIDSR